MGGSGGGAWDELTRHCRGNDLSRGGTSKKKFQQKNRSQGKKGETTEFNVTLSVFPKLMYFVTLQVDGIVPTLTQKPFTRPFCWLKSKPFLIGLGFFLVCL